MVFHYFLSKVCSKLKNIFLLCVVFHVYRCNGLQTLACLAGLENRLGRIILHEVAGLGRMSKIESFLPPSRKKAELYVQMNVIFNKQPFIKSLDTVVLYSTGTSLQLKKG
jgi:hypothetical protein